jgi:shikimate dehydrogenase
MDRTTSADALKRSVTNDPFENVDPNTLDYVCGIVGGDNPSSYSRSPWIWNHFFSELKINAHFTTFDLPPNKPFADFARAVVQIPGLLDLTVTSPYKATAFQHLRHFGFTAKVTERSQQLGCLNHIMVRPGSKEATVDFTDGWGLIRALKKRRSLSEAQVLLIGAGGAGTAIGYELVCEGATLSITNIVESDVQELNRRLADVPSRTGPVPRAVGWDERGTVARNADVVISAISATSPLTAEEIEAIAEDCLFADTRYGHRADFAMTVRNVGRECIDGREMLFGQFALAAYTVGSLLERSESDVRGAVDRVEQWFMSQPD